MSLLIDKALWVGYVPRSLVLQVSTDFSRTISKAQTKDIIFNDSSWLRLQVGQMLLYLRISSNNRMLPFCSQILDVFTNPAQPSPIAVGQGLPPGPLKTAACYYGSIKNCMMRKDNSDQLVVLTQNGRWLQGSLRGPVIYRKRTPDLNALLLVFSLGA